MKYYNDLGERLCSMRWRTKRQVKARSTPAENCGILQNRVHKENREETRDSCVEGWKESHWPRATEQKDTPGGRKSRVEGIRVLGVMWYNSQLSHLGALVSDSQRGQDPSNYLPGKYLLGISKWCWYWSVKTKRSPRTPSLSSSFCFGTHAFSLSDLLLPMRSPTLVGLVI